MREVSEIRRVNGTAAPRGRTNVRIAASSTIDDHDDTRDAHHDPRDDHSRIPR